MPLNLLVVPVAFTYVLGFERRVKALFRRQRDAARPAVPAEESA